MIRGCRRCRSLQPGRPGKDDTRIPSAGAHVALPLQSGVRRPDHSGRRRALPPPGVPTSLLRQALDQRHAGMLGRIVPAPQGLGQGTVTLEGVPGSPVRMANQMDVSTVTVRAAHSPGDPSQVRLVPPKFLGRRRADQPGPPAAASEAVPTREVAHSPWPHGNRERTSAAARGSDHTKSFTLGARW